MRKIVTIGLGAVFALGLAAGALAGGYGGGYGSSSTTTTTSSAGSSSAKSETYRFKATLAAAQEVPKPKATAGAGGTFTARTVEKGSAKTFTWKLTFHGLTGPAGAAHVHFGKKGVAGAVAIPLCGPCKSGQTGTVKITGKAEDAMETGRAYVNVHTAKNAAGEIRGQVAASK
jgi:CHRD domain-containing protein